MHAGVVKALLALTGIFVAGAVTGGVSGVAWERHQAHKLCEKEVAERQLSRLEASLELTAQQIDCMRPIMSEFAERVRIARRNAMADVAEVWREINAQLERELTPHQLAKFRKIQAQDEAHMSREAERRCPEDEVMSLDHKAKPDHKAKGEQKAKDNAKPITLPE
jgi:hypothetical protein